MRLLVFGSRTWLDVPLGSSPDEAKRRARQGVVFHGSHYRAVRDRLIALARRHDGFTLIEGEADGADILSRVIVENELCLPFDPFPVDREKDGPWPAAGHRRNARMHRNGRPDAALGFISGKRGEPYSKGSAGMVNICRLAQTPLTIVREDGEEA